MVQGSIRGHVDVHACAAAEGYAGSVIPEPGPVLMSVACVTTKGHADDGGPCCSLKPW